MGDEVMRNYFAPLRLCVRFLLGTMGVLLITPPLPAQGLDYVKAHYTKTEHLIPMRDGVRLFTAPRGAGDDPRRGAPAPAPGVLF